MELLLIRHGLPVRRELVDGPADPELSEAGLAQAQRLAEYLAAETLDAVYASPMRRAHQTAMPIAASRGLDITLIDGVAEWDRNSNEYVPVEELKATNDPRYAAMMSGEWTVADETREEFHARVVDAVESLVEVHPGQRIAVSCHGGVINSYIGHVLGLTVGQHFFYPNYTSIHRVVASRRGHREVVTLNETAHLRGSGLPIGLVQS